MIVLLINVIQREFLVILSGRSPGILNRAFRVSDIPHTLKVLFERLWVFSPFCD